MCEGLKRVNRLSVSNYQIFIDSDNLKENLLDPKELQKISSVVEKANAIIILFSDTIVASIELDKLFTDEDEIFVNKYVASIITRPCIWRDVSWIKKGSIFPYSGMPISTSTGVEAEGCLIDLIEEIIDRFKLNINRKSEDDNQPKVFVSYSRKDGYFADLLKYKLEENNITVQMDVAVLIPGNNWKLKIDQMIEESDLILVVCSSNSKVSEYVIYEFSYGMGKKKPVIPIVIEENVELHPKLKDINVYTSLIDRTTNNWDNLASNIRNFLKLENRIP